MKSFVSISTNNHSDDYYQLTEFSIEHEDSKDLNEKLDEILKIFVIEEPDIGPAISSVDELTVFVQDMNDYLSLLENNGQELLSKLPGASMGLNL